MSRLSRSRSASRSSSSCLPSTARSVVCASWLVASRKFSTWMIAFSGSTTRKYSTALTFTETLSRVITSWLGHVEHHDAQADAHHLLHAGNQDHQARPLDLPEAPELEHHAALVLAQDAQRRRREHRQQQHEQADSTMLKLKNMRHALAGLSWLSSATCSARPSTRVTRTRRPARRPLGAAHLPVSPWICAQPSPSANSTTRRWRRPASRRRCTGGRRRAFAAMPATTTTKPAETERQHARSATAARRSPARRCRSAAARRSRTPRRRRCPSAPKVGRKASATRKAMPEQDQRQPGVVDRQHLQPEQRQQQADRRRPRPAARSPGSRTRTAGRRCRPSSGSAPGWAR